MEKALSELDNRTEAMVKRLDGGIMFKRKLEALNVRRGKTLKVVAKQPFYGPIVIEIDGRQVTIGREMAKRIFVEGSK